MGIFFGSLRESRARSANDFGKKMILLWNVPDPEESSTTGTREINTTGGRAKPDVREAHKPEVFRYALLIEEESL